MEGKQHILGDVFVARNKTYRSNVNNRLCNQELSNKKR
jgi:hypothetical protein